MYVGKAKNLRKRLHNYASPKRLSDRIERMVSLIDNILLTNTSTEINALILEAELIKKLRPKYNVLLKDDKSFPFLLITQDEFPRITKHRGDHSQIGGDFFGPFISSKSLTSYIEELCKLFGIRNCSDSFFRNRSRPCLRYFIKRCSAPCMQKIACEEYHKSVLELKRFLRSEKTQHIQQLEMQMQELSREEKFEQAAILRDQIAILQQMQRYVAIVDGGGKFMQRGEICRKKGEQKGKSS